MLEETNRWSTAGICTLLLFGLVICNVVVPSNIAMELFASILPCPPIFYTLVCVAHWNKQHRLQCLSCAYIQFGWGLLTFSAVDVIVLFGLGGLDAVRVWAYYLK